MLCKCGRAECFICGLVARRPEYAERFANAARVLRDPSAPRASSAQQSVAAAPVGDRANCVYLGEVISSRDASGNYVSCSSKWLRECERHGECRIGQSSTAATCRGCGDYRTSEPSSFAVVTIGIGEEFRELAKRNGRTVCDYFVVPELLVIGERDLQRFAPPRERFPDPQRQIHWMKFAIPLIFPWLERWIYVDADYRVVRGGHPDKLAMLRTDSRLIAVEDWWDDPPAKPYFQGGFYVANLKEHGKLFEWCRDHYFETPERFGEQCVWNAGIKALGVDVLTLPRSFNVGKREQCDEPIGVHGYWYDKVDVQQIARFDETTLARGVVGKRFNPSIIDYEDGFLFAFRNGWAGSEVYVIRMDKQFRPYGNPTRLALRKGRESGFGREDPRLFWHKGQVHCMFTGVAGRAGPTNVLFARLDKNFKVDGLFYPRVPGRRSWEKNHCYFDVDGDLYAIYAIDGHRIMRVRSEDVEFVHSGPSPRPWVGGEPRGGASPVKVGDEFWHFFHSRREREGHRIYEMGLYTFSAKPPFHPLRIIPEPLMIADPTTKPGDQYASVVWPGGAVRDGDRWVVALGIHDRWSELHAMSHADLEAKLVPVLAG